MSLRADPKGSVAVGWPPVHACGRGVSARMRTLSVSVAGAPKTDSADVDARGSIPE
jgi:hypothetical protein